MLKTKTTKRRERMEGREKKGNIGLEYDWSQPNLSVILL
jgi:hypothetical protein